MPPLLRVAIVGGGPGGLITAYRLQQRHPGLFQVTLFEATDRLGGKVLSPRFDLTDVTYEAGAAELYDYSHLGPDPLRELIAELGLSTYPMSGEGVILGDHLLMTTADLGRAFGEETAGAFAQFDEMARREISPTDYYESDWRTDDADALAQLTFGALLDQVGSATARRYIEVAVHSDLATEPDLTTGTYGLQNCLMNHRQYMSLYGIDGGMEGLTRELAGRLGATHILLRQRVIRVGRTAEGSYSVSSRLGSEVVEDDFDFVVVALPTNWIPFVDWEGPGLEEAMRRHVAHYRHPAHYLRVSLLYDRPFWRDRVVGSYFMTDAFGGSCFYDEGLRKATGGHGVLGVLIAGEPALTLANLDEKHLVDRVRQSLPRSLGEADARFLEAKVHRWLGAVNGLPGGRPRIDVEARHIPDPEHNPWLFVVGDYLFDTTLNGVLDSADHVVELLVEEQQEAAAQAAAAEALSLLQVESAVGDVRPLPAPPEQVHTERRPATAAVQTTAPVAPRSEAT